MRRVRRLPIKHSTEQAAAQSSHRRSMRAQLPTAWFLRSSRWFSSRAIRQRDFCRVTDLNLRIVDSRDLFLALPHNPIAHAWAISLLLQNPSLGLTLLETPELASEIVTNYIGAVSAILWNAADERAKDYRDLFLIGVRRFYATSQDVVDACDARVGVKDRHSRILQRATKNLRKRPIFEQPAELRGYPPLICRMLGVPWVLGTTAREVA